MKVRDIKSAHRRYWFSPDTMRFFNSRVNLDQDAVEIGGEYYFTSSEQFDHKSPRLYSVRAWNPETDDIRTIGEFQGYRTAREARAKINRLKKAAE